MPRHDSRALANEFLRRRTSTSWPAQMQIQKLVHIANGWNLAINGEPLVLDNAEAWDNGPVFRRIWDFIRDFGYRGENHSLINPNTQQPFQANLLPQEEAVINHVWAKYGAYSPERLSAMTHTPDSPWYRAYFGRGRNSVLDNNDLMNHYRALAMAGREQQE